MFLMHSSDLKKKDPGKEVRRLDPGHLLGLLGEHTMISSMITLLGTQSRCFSLSQYRNAYSTRHKCSYLMALSRKILMALASPNIGKQIKATTSSKVGLNSPQAGQNYVFLRSNRKSELCLLCIEILFAMFKAF